MSFLSFKNSCFSFTAASFKSGKINNIIAMSSGLFACEKITFEEPFSGGKQVKVFVSPGNSTNGAAVWVESEDQIKVNFALASPSTAMARMQLRNETGLSWNLHTPEHN